MRTFTEWKVMFSGNCLGNCWPWAPEQDNVSVGVVLGSAVSTFRGVGRACNELHEFCF